VQRLFVDFMGSLVGARKATAGLIDPLLRQILDHQQMPNRVACLDQFAVRRNDLRSLDHAAQSTGPGHGRIGAPTPETSRSCSILRGGSCSTDTWFADRGSDRLSSMAESMAAKQHSWMLVAGGRPDSADGPGSTLSKRPVLLAVARRGIPNLVEATIIPAILFLLIVTTVGAGAAMMAVLVWGYGAVLRRTLRGDPIPTILLLATLGLTVKTAVGLMSGSTFAYFLQPIATTVVLAGVFIGSVVIGRPVIARLAHDFCPIAPDVATRPGVVQLFAGLTVLWSGVHVLTAAATLGMLLSMPLPMFIALKTITCLGITVAAIVITVVWALRTARHEQLVFAPARGELA
jgi:hypothetical protein